MPTHRSLRIAEAIREVVATAILFDVADPRVRKVTVLRVEVSGDSRQAVVYVSVMGSEAEQKRALEGLTHATGFLQARVAARLQIRFTPVLSFKRDSSVKKSVELTRLIEEAIAADQRPEATPTESVAAAPEEPSSVQAAQPHSPDDSVSESS